MIISVLCGVIGYSNQTAERTHNALTIANVEALTDDESEKCPDYNYIQDHYIVIEEFYITVTCTKKGELQIGSETLYGSFEKGETYTIAKIVKSCVGFLKGACCDQREEGTEYLYD